MKFLKISRRKQVAGSEEFMPWLRMKNFRPYKMGNFRWRLDEVENWIKTRPVSLNRKIKAGIKSGMIQAEVTRIL